MPTCDLTQSIHMYIVYGSFIEYQTSRCIFTNGCLEQTDKEQRDVVGPLEKG